MEQEPKAARDGGLVDVTKKEIQAKPEGARSVFSLGCKGAKSDVLSSAASVFTEKGVEETTVQDLLEAANVSRRTFYKYFKNKVDVLESIYEVQAELMLSQFQQQQRESDSMPDFIVRCVDLYLGYHVKIGPLLRMMMEEARKTDSPLAVHRQVLLDHIVGLLDKKYKELEGVHLNKKVFYALIWMLESVSMNILSQLPCSDEELNEYKETMFAIASRIVLPNSSKWSDIPDLPITP